MNKTEKLIAQTALALYGKLGTQAVSLNSIRKHSGVQNEAAIRYYFRNKQGLLACVLRVVADDLEPKLKAVLQQLQHEPKKLTAVDVISGFATPLIELSSRSPESIRFIGSLIREEGKQGQGLLLETFGNTLLAFEALLRRIRPKEPASVIRLHLYLTINTLVFGLIDLRGSIAC